LIILFQLGLKVLEASIAEVRRHHEEAKATDAVNALAAAAQTPQSKDPTDSIASIGKSADNQSSSTASSWTLWAVEGISKSLESATMTAGESTGISTPSRERLGSDTARTREGPLKSDVLSLPRNSSYNTDNSDSINIAMNEDNNNGTTDAWDMDVDFDDDFPDPPTPTAHNITSFSSPAPQEVKTILSKPRDATSNNLAIDSKKTVSTTCTTGSTTKKATKVAVKKLAVESSDQDAWDDF
jgi:hypothetical protein